MKQIQNIESISQLHRLIGYAKPKHPLVTLIDLSGIENQSHAETTYSLGFYSIVLKKMSGELKYGRGYYDFEEGSMIFMSPGQTLSSGGNMNLIEGWALYFHPDLIKGTELGLKILQYTFFSYESNEALHLSEDEKKILTECVKNIEREYSQNIDNHTQNLIVANIELMLNYCSRFYDRQFLTRKTQNGDLIQRFETILIEYFESDKLIEEGLPKVGYLAAKLNLSPNYLSDLLKKFTGKNTIEHVHYMLIDKAKNMLIGTEKSISEIAFDLGFEYPSHFSKMFKSKVGTSPLMYRNDN